MNRIKRDDNGRANHKQPQLKEKKTLGRWLFPEKGKEEKKATMESCLFGTARVRKEASRFCISIYCPKPKRSPFIQMFMYAQNYLLIASCLPGQIGYLFRGKKGKGAGANFGRPAQECSLEKTSGFFTSLVQNKQVF